MPILPIMDSADVEVRKLIVENNALKEEVKQIKSDKEFVWSLWKRLQISNPDVTQAISVVVNREQLRAEEKDKKVLEILEVKDNMLTELQHQVENMKTEMSDIVKRKVMVSQENVEMKEELKEFQERNRNLEDVVADFEETQKSSADSNRHVISDLKRENDSLSKKFKDVINELEKYADDEDSSRHQKSRLDSKCQRLEREVTESNKEIDRLLQEHTEAVDAFRKQEKQFQNQSREVEINSRELELRNREIDQMRNEMYDLRSKHEHCGDKEHQQSCVIQQLQTLQQDTEKVLSNQEQAHLLEISGYKKMYTDLVNQNKCLQDNEQIIREQFSILQQEFDDYVLEREGESVSDEGEPHVDRPHQSVINSNPPSCVHCKKHDYQVYTLNTEIEVLKGQVRQRNGVVEALQASEKPQRLGPGQGHRSRVSNRQRVTNKRSASCSPPRRNGRSQSSVDLARRLATADMRLNDAEKKLKLQNVEIDEVRQAHNRRLERLKYLQKDYNLMKEQLRTYEFYERDEKLRRDKGRGPQGRRQPPGRPLTQEDTDTVWHEITFLKQQNRDLIQERMNLEEETDTLKVQHTADVNMMQELRSCLQREKQELEDVLSEQQAADFDEKYDYQKKYETMLKKYKAAERQMKRVEENKITLVKELEDIQKEHKKVAVETKNLRKDAHTYQQTCTENESIIKQLSKHCQTLNKKLRRNKKQQISKKLIANKHHRDSSYMRKKKELNTQLKQHQGMLNDSINYMKQYFPQFDSSGWEEVSSGTEENGSTDVMIDTSQQETESSIRVPTLRKLPEKLKRKNPTFKRNSKHVGTRRRRTADVVGVCVEEGTNNTVTESSINTDPHHPHCQCCNNRLKNPGHQTHDITPRNGLPNKKSNLQRRRELDIRNQELKKQVSSLSEQLSVLRNAKDFLEKKNTEFQQQNDKYQTDLNSARQRCQSLKSHNQRLAVEVEVCQREKAFIEKQIATETTPRKQQQSRTESDWKQLETKLKTTTCEISKQLAQIKQLKQDGEQSNEQLKQLKEKLGRQDRDVAQKRSLIEQLREKISTIEKCTKNETNTMREQEEKMKNLRETNELSRKNIESLRKQLEHYQTLYTQTLLDLEAKKKKLETSYQQRMHAENVADDLEIAATRTLKGFAAQSEDAIEQLECKLKIAGTIIIEFNKFVRNFVSELLAQLHDSRASLKQTKQKFDEQQRHKQLNNDVLDVSNSSLTKAQDLACNILNISHAELEDLMNPTEPETDVNKFDSYAGDNNWKQRCEKALCSKGHFAPQLLSLCLEMIGEYVSTKENLISLNVK